MLGKRIGPLGVLGTSLGYLLRPSPLSDQHHRCHHCPRQTPRDHHHVEEEPVESRALEGDEVA